MIQKPNTKMEIVFNASFRKAYHKSTLKLRKAFDTRLKLFKRDSDYPLLHDHKLTGKLQGYRAFSVTGDVRTVYYVKNNTAYFVDIGTHNQVYGI